jgi:hypothetical protein
MGDGGVAVEVGEVMEVGAGQAPEGVEGSYVGSGLR